MAKKETKKPDKKVKEKKGKDSKNPKTVSIPGGSPSSPGVPPTGMASNGVPVSGVPSTGAPTGAAGTIPMSNTPSIPLSSMSPDQMNVQQLEQAIKESTAPDAQLKKLHSPINIKSCLLNILLLIVLTLVIVIIWCAVAVDKFNFGTVVKDMSSQFGITQGFQWLWAQISGWFS